MRLVWLLMCLKLFFWQVRKGFNDGADIVHTWLPRAASWGAVAATIHGRTR